MIYNKKNIWKHGSKPDHIKDKTSWVQLGYVVDSVLEGKELQDRVRDTEPRFFMYYSFDTSLVYLKDIIKDTVHVVEFGAQARGFMLADSIIKKDVNWDHTVENIKHKLVSLSLDIKEKNIDVDDLLNDLKILRR